ncbi:hypothetical protein [Anaeroselena agilis]|uniref:Type VI secretion system spike protein VgrG3-like C-terminal domain-containing protein n=1 Tax=Anaeroselena agilis TaxID=3063788 RepID=A0ABU3NV08_9FIRM|nr:hypothetical protein [Selenomonadales bacterium 4137-cl]
MELGHLSAKYESNGDPGAIAYTVGDAGGASYGAYQFATNAGIPQDFCASMELDWGVPGTQEFDANWRAMAEADPEGFLLIQHRYVYEKYFVPAHNLLAASGFYLSSHSEALGQVVWSAAVQYGPGYIVELFNTAAALSGVNDPNELPDRVLIENIYVVRASDEWTAGSPSLRPGLRDRFAAECQDALAMLEE